MKFLRKSLVLILLLTVHVLASYNSHKDWTYNLIIYEVNLRNYTSSGTFKEFLGHIERLRDLGVGIIWFMPIHPIGEKNRLGSLGSPYSVKDYYGINPEYGTMEDFKSAVDSIHRSGMYVIMDWVGNHTSWDNVLTKEHPDWYMKDDKGNFMPPPGTNWTDVIQLDYTNKELWEYMIDAMKFWIQECDIDGFRCDAVDFMPKEFWEEAIPRLREVKPELFMLAEGDDVEYHQIGFDMTYGWRLYGFGVGILRELYSGSTNAYRIDFFVKREIAEFYNKGYYRMYFTSNHDENSWYGTVFERFGEAAKCFAILTGAIGGMQLIYGGQEAGLSKRLKFFDKDLIFWREHSFYNIY